MCVIRAVTPQDVSVILPMQKKLAIVQDILELWQPDAQRMKLHLTSGSPKIFGFIAHAGSEPVGYCLYHLSDYSSFATRWKSVFIDDIFVVERKRTTGIGKQLLQHVAKAAQELGIDQIKLDVHRDNAAAKAAYDSLGAHTPPTDCWERLHIIGAAFHALHS